MLYFYFHNPVNLTNPFLFNINSLNISPLALRYSVSELTKFTKQSSQKMHRKYALIQTY